MYRFLYEYKSLYLWDKCRGVQLLDCVVVECWLLKETTKQFSRVAVPFYIPTSNI